MKRKSLKNFTKMHSAVSRVYNVIHFRAIASKKWRLILVVFAAIVVLVGVFNLLIATRIASIVAAKYPEAHAIQTTLAVEYPDKDINVSDQTFYNAENSHNGKRRILGVSVAGKDFITRNEAKHVKDVICTSLPSGQKKFDAIVLQSTKEKRFLIFFSRQNNTSKISCDSRETVNEQ